MARALLFEAGVGAQAHPGQQPLLQRRAGLGQPELLEFHLSFGEGAGLVAADHTQ